MPRGGTITPINPGLVARVSGAVKGAIRGASDGWFGPGQPLAPVAPEEVRGRQFDFPVAWNTPLRPRSEQGESGLDFATLRQLADPVQGGFDLLRLAIETRKDQMESQRWKIQARDEKGDGGPAARAIEKALRFPDVEHTFAQWQRMLLEDLLVIDAPTVYLAPTVQGHRLPQIMDGGTLKRLIRGDGRTPLPPDPAFQQLLKGLPAVDYSLDELVYMPRNLRSHRVYGMSPVEQVVMTVSIALRRQLHQLEEYTEGNVPELLITAPLDWQPNQIKEIQQWFDTLAGDTATRRRMRLVPGGLTPFPLHGSPMKDEFDEWLAKIICYCFSLSPQALIKQMNRASADTAKQSAQEEGLEPLKNWWKDLMDAVLTKAFDAGELEYAYQDEEIGDASVKAEVFSLALGKGGGKGWLTQNEVRAAFGYDDLTPEQQAELNPPAPDPAVPPGTDQQSTTDAQAEADKKVAAIQERAAAPVLALASGVSEIAKALRSRPAPPKRTLKFVTDPNTGAIAGAVEE